MRNYHIGVINRAITPLLGFLRRLRVVAEHRAALADLGVVRPRAADPHDAGVRELVSVGRAVSGMDVRAADDDGNSVPDGHVGEIELRGAAVMTGYLNNRQATDAAFTGDGWLRTGDLGVTIDGDLFITGRRKEMIIVQGQNYYPEDAESVVRNLPAVHRRRCIAFSDTEAEQLVVAVESREEPSEAERSGE